MEKIDNTKAINSIYFLDHTLIEFSNNSTEKVLKKRYALELQLKEAYEELNDKI